MQNTPTENNFSRLRKPTSVDVVPGTLLPIADRSGG